MKSKGSKKILAFLVMAIMLIGLVPTTAMADTAKQQVRVIVENTTFTEASADSENLDPAWTGTLLDEWVDIDSSSTMMSCVKKAIESKGYTQTGAENNYISAINGLEEFAGGGQSGWMGTLNDWFTSEGFDGYTVANGKLEAGDEIRIMYTCSYGADLGGTWDNTDKSIKSVTFSTGTLDKTFSSADKEYTLTIPKGTDSVTVTPTAANKNYMVKTYLGTQAAGTVYKRTAQIPVKDGDVITVVCGDKEWPTMNNNSGDAQVYTFKISIGDGGDIAPDGSTWELTDTVRIWGKLRYDTAKSIADTMKQGLNIEKFDNIIVATGENYPDALAGGYLAKVKNAPIIMVSKDAGREADVKQYISDNLAKGGTVYILGGIGVVRSEFEASVKNLKDADNNQVNVKRLGGQSRYDTNIAILKEAGIDKDMTESTDLLVCTGEGFADSLSASAAGKPILLAAKTGLNSTQKNYLKSIDINDVYLIGGTGAVSDSTGNQMKAYNQGSKCERVAGSDRYKTSVAVAEKFFPDSVDSAVLAYAQTFPDGLAGGPLALSINAPLLLVDSNGYSAAADYAKTAGIEKAAVLGGAGLIPDSVVNKILK